MGRALKLSHITMASGAVYFHRFYMFHSFQDFPRYVSCLFDLFLVAKCESEPGQFFDSSVLICFTGGWYVLPLPGGQGRGDAQKVQGSHQGKSKAVTGFPVYFF